MRGGAAVAKYNTFVVQQTKNGKTVLVTSSARKVSKLLAPGIRVEVWSENRKTETIYTKTRAKLDSYVAAERDYIRAKQAAAEHRNRMRRARKCN
jgi:hypothetical protein